MSTRDYLVKAKAEAAETRRAAARAEYAANRAIEVYDTTEPTPAPPPAPAPAPAPSPTLSGITIDGDSISIDYAGYYTGAFNRAHPEYPYYCAAVGGSQLPDLVARRDTLLAKNSKVHVVCVGANDLFKHATAENYLSDLESYVEPFEAKGTKVLVATQLPISSPLYSDENKAKHEANRQALRPLLEERFEVIPFGSIPEMQDPTNLQMYKDGLHPTDRNWNGKKAGHDYMYEVFEPIALAALGQAAPVPSDPRPADWLKTEDVPIKALDPALEAEWIGVGPAHEDWEQADLPGDAYDVVGAFRLIGNVTHLDQDDLLLFPGVPGGAGHWHQHFTTEGGPLNASNYWLHPLMDDLGRIKPFGHAALYYKRYPDFGDTIPQSLRDAYGDKWNASIEQHHSNHGPLSGIPRGLRMVFGWGKQKWIARRGDWNGPAIADSTGQTLFSDLTWLRTQLQPGDVLYMQMGAPPFWDGVHSGSPDHMMHVSYTQSAQFPIRMPTLTLIPAYLVTAEDRPATWRLSCDGPNDAPGSTAHGSYIENWPEALRLEWEKNAIDRMLNCSGGDLGSGRQLKRPANYDLTGQPPLVTPTGTGRIDL